MTNENKTPGDKPPLEEVVNKAVGSTTSGSQFTIFPRHHTEPVETIQTWEGFLQPEEEIWGVIGIRCIYRNGESAAAGFHTDSPANTFTFLEKEHIVAMQLYTESTIHRIHISTSQGRPFSSGGNEGPKTVRTDMKIGNGLLLGFSGTSDEKTLYSLSVYFHENGDAKV